MTSSKSEGTNKVAARHPTAQANVATAFSLRELGSYYVDADDGSYISSRDAEKRSRSSRD
jgi:hypothetical protein